MTTKTYNNEVELTFDNGVESGSISFDIENMQEGLVSFYTCVGNVELSYPEDVVTVTVDKQNLITFLEKSLEMLKKEV